MDRHREQMVMILLGVTRKDLLGAMRRDTYKLVLGLRMGCWEGSRIRQDQTKSSSMTNRNGCDSLRIRNIWERHEDYVHDRDRCLCMGCRCTISLNRTHVNF